MENSRLKDIYKNLKQNNFDVYFAGQHKGDCTKPYVVVKPGITTKHATVSALIHYFDILCYVPKDKPSGLIEFISKVQKSLLQLSPMIKFNGAIQDSYFDESVNGWLADLEYINYSKYDSDVFQKLNISEEINH